MTDFAAIRAGFPGVGNFVSRHAAQTAGDAGTTAYDAKADEFSKLIGQHPAGSGAEPVSSIRFAVARDFGAYADPLRSLADDVTNGLPVADERPGGGVTNLPAEVTPWNDGEFTNLLPGASDGPPEGATGDEALPVDPSNVTNGLPETGDEGTGTIAGGVTNALPKVDAPGDDAPEAV